MRLLCQSITLFLLGIFVVAGWASDNEEAPARVDHRYNDAVAAAKAANYDKAIELLNQLAKERPKDPDVQNYLGYSYRKKGDKKEGMNHYEKALSLNPKHRGALEYQGELFLELNDPAKAKGNLARLESVCGKSCPEYVMLQNSIAHFAAAGEASAY